MSATTDALAFRAKLLLDNTMAVVARVDEHALVERRAPTAPPIAFHLWHMARWADLMQARVSAAVPRLGERAEIWTSERLADVWHVDVPLGRFDSGMEMGDEASATMTYPTREALVDYVRRALEAALELYRGVSDEDAAIVARDPYDREASVATMLVANLTHLNRHLGMIEALIGVAGRIGSASV